MRATDMRVHPIVLTRLMSLAATGRDGPYLRLSDLAARYRVRQLVNHTLDHALSAGQAFLRLGWTRIGSPGIFG